MYSNTAALTTFLLAVPSSSSSSRFNVLKNDSAQALSQQLPFLLMLRIKCGRAAPEAARKAVEQY